MTGAPIGRRTAVRTLAAVLSLAAALSPAAAAPAQTNSISARNVVEKFHDSLIGVMRDAARLGYAGRYRILAPEIARAFHLPVMTRVAAGRFWKKFSGAQKSALVDAFSRMTAATYAHRFDGFGGESFRVVREVPMRRKTLLVKTQLVKANGETIDLDYLMRRFASGWRVIDVYLKGTFSELATRRSEYSSMLRRDGLNALIARIDRKVAAYEKGAAAK